MTYFIRRDPVDASGYYGDRKDPDGKMRSQLSAEEFAISAADIRQEAAYLIGCNRVMDLGCGTGAVGHYAQASYALAVDPDASAREAVAKRYPWAAVAQSVHGYTGPAEFDGLISYHAAEHMADPVGTFAAALGLCIAGAKIVVSTPDFASPAARKYGNRFRLLHDPTHISLFSTTGLVDMLRDLGVEIDRIVYPFRGTRWERAAAEWVDAGDNFCPPAPGSIVSVYGWKR